MRRLRILPARLNYHPAWLSLTTIVRMPGKQKGDIDGAISDYTKALEQRPKYAEALYNRGLAWQSKGEFDAAIKDYFECVGNRTAIRRGVCQSGTGQAIQTGLGRRHL